RLSFVHDSSLPVRLFLLRVFHDYALIFVAHPFALIRLRWAITTNFSCNLSNDLLVGPLDDDLGRGRTLDSNPLGELIHDVVRKAQLQTQGLTLSLCPETHPNEVELAVKARAHADDHIVDQRTHGSGHGTCMTCLVGGHKGDLTVFNGDGDVLVS